MLPYVKMQKNNNLESIRGIACLLVIITHLSELHPSLAAMHLNLISNWGTEAVIVFFILSGLVINSSQTNNRKTRSKFLSNRIIRLFPQFMIGVILAILSIMYLGFPFPSLREIVLNSLMLSTLQGFLVKNLYTNAPLWSLTFEMFFYAIFALSIGKNEKRIIYFWFFYSIIALPFYYLDLANGLLMHIIAMFSFSSIWLIGYFVYEFKDKFWVGRFSAIFSLGMLPLVSRLQITDQFYDPVKFLLFAIVSIPFFRFCLDQEQTGKKINQLIVIPTYGVLIFMIFLYSDSRFVSKVLYIALPLIILSIDRSLILFSASGVIKAWFKQITVILGKYSYSLYIIHYPVFFVMAALIPHWLPFIILSCALVGLVSWWLENIYQQGINRYYHQSSSISQLG